MSCLNQQKVSPPQAEAFEDKNATAAVCRSVPNGLNALNSQINDCTTTTELNRNTNFASNTFKLQKVDILHNIVCENGPRELNGCDVDIILPINIEKIIM